MRLNILTKLLGVTLICVALIGCENESAITAVNTDSAIEIAPRTTPHEVSDVPEGPVENSPLPDVLLPDVLGDSPLNTIAAKSGSIASYPFVNQMPCSSWNTCDISASWPSATPGAPDITYASGSNLFYNGSNNIRQAADGYWGYHYTRYNLDSPAQQMDFYVYAAWWVYVAGYDAGGNLVSGGWYAPYTSMWPKTLTGDIHSFEIGSWNWYGYFYQLDVTYANEPPTADAGADQTVHAGSAVTLDGSGSSDPDGDTLTYEWKDSGGNVVSTGATANVGPFNVGTYTYTLSVDDGNGESDSDEVTVNVIPIPAAVDIMPGSSKNPVNTKSKGAIPVAILSNGDLDATTVDPLSISFGPGSATESHGKGHTEDVNGDGLDDLVLHFKTQDSGLSKNDTTACLTGVTFDGYELAGCDVVSVK